MPTILLVEDDLVLSEVISCALTAAGHELDSFVSGSEGLEQLQSRQYDLVIVDWGLPGITGIEICTQFRSTGGTTPILFLTGKTHIDEKTIAFEQGADDYLTKPFNMRELMARVSALLKRPKQYVGDTICVGEFVLDLKAFCAKRNGTTISLTVKEFAVLELMMRYPNTVFSSEELLSRIWKLDAAVSDDTVRSCLNRLRIKLQEPSPIVTIKRKGYKLSV